MEFAHFVHVLAVFAVGFEQKRSFSARSKGSNVLERLGTTTMSTYIPSAKEITRKWFLVDASGKTLGRLATEVASILAGKRNPKYVPYIDMGDHVIVINAEKIVLTGLKASQKLYRRYTGFPGGLREESFLRVVERRPEKIVEEAVQGMLPKSKMGRQMATKLQVYRGDKHPHQAQQPVALDFETRNGQKKAS
jgi:large subunit ribosomal protein L13